MLIIGYRGKATIVWASNTKIWLTSENATSTNEKLLAMASGHFKPPGSLYCGEWGMSQDMFIIGYRGKVASGHLGAPIVGRRGRHRTC